MIDIRKTIEDHPFTVILGIIITTIGVTYTVVTYLENSKNEIAINGYKNTISSIERRLGGKESIDISKLISLASNSQLTSKSIFFPKDNFFATKDDYWTYKYTNLGELICIKNGVLPPKELVNNPMDMPLHIWFGGEKFNVTELGEYPFKGEIPSGGLKVLPDNQGVVYSLDQVIFNTLIVLQKWDKNGNSIKQRKLEHVDSVTYAINFYEIPKSELMGRFLYFEIKNFYEGLPVDYISKEVLSVQKVDDILYSQFLTTYQDIEINKKKRDKFYLYTEFILINSNDNLYSLRIESPSLEPRKIGVSFQKITEWFAEFGIVKN